MLFENKIRQILFRMLKKSEINIKGMLGCILKYLNTQIPIDLSELNLPLVKTHRSRLWKFNFYTFFGHFRGRPLFFFSGTTRNYEYFFYYLTTFIISNNISL